MARWGRDRPGHNDFILDPLGPAWHIDRTRFETALRVRAEAAGAQLLTSTRLHAIQITAHGARVQVYGPSGGLVVQAAWLIDASGPGARVARRLGARRLVVDRLSALIRFVRLAEGTFTAQTLLESTPHGWWYAARLPGDRLVTALITAPQEVPPLTADGWAGWRRALAGTSLLAQQMTDVRLHSEPGSQRRGVRPVVVSRLDRVAGERWLAVGDAAAELDPITGRGIHEALTDATHAARAWLTGRPESTSYQTRITDRFVQHVAERSAYYDLERRWAAAPFWSGRSHRTLAE